MGSQTLCQTLPGIFTNKLSPLSVELELVSEVSLEMEDFKLGTLTLEVSFKLYWCMPRYAMIPN